MSAGNVGNYKKRSQAIIFLRATRLVHVFFVKPRTKKGVMQSEKIDELVNAIQARQEVLLNEIKKHEITETSLEDLGRSMGESDAFDKEDVAAVQAEIKKHKEATDTLRARYNKEVEVKAAHDELFSCLQNVINTRQKLLDEEDNKTKVLEKHPALLEYLAQKQLSLGELITTKLEALMHGSEGAELQK